MRFSLNFIEEFLDIDMPPQKLAQVLTMAGMEVENFQKAGDDWIFDIEVTTNRYDWLSVAGIAREISACLRKKIKIHTPSLVTKPLLKDRDIVIENLTDCPLYVGHSIKNVKISPSLNWLKELLVNCGIASINNVVDITNYCMLKWGNPLHAFDEDKIQGNIYIRRAKEDEKFIGIDSKERILSKENLVIADDKKVIALAGVMGAKNTEIDLNTKNVFLEAAVFSALTIRHSRRLAGLDTDSSYRFERQVFKDNLMSASQESAILIEEVTKGEFGGYKCVGKKESSVRNSINLSLEKLDEYIGEKFNAKEVKEILVCLGFSVKESKKGLLKITAPDFRFDIVSEVDVYEEISRIYGYEKIKPSLALFTPQIIEDKLYDFKNKLRDFLYSINLKEIISYSIVAQDDLKKLNYSDFILLANPLRKQENAMRPTLLTGMISAVKYNLNRELSGLNFFEIADTYKNKENSFDENPTLAIGLEASMGSFFTLKGIIKSICDFLNITDYELKKEGQDNFTNALTIYVANEKIGFLGKLNSSIANAFDLKSDLFFGELNILALLKAKKDKTFKPYSSYPAVFRDISILLAQGKNFSEIEKIIKSNECSPSYKVIDIYRGKNIPQGSTAFTLRVFYQSYERTLLSQEVDTIHNKLRETLCQIQGITLR